ncbi:MAG: hypothetical protein OEZ15_07660, partial [Gammaproteobacteria bacterium]|nr:hypothetical protein [Gammaproteobacteria bacterium]
IVFGPHMESFIDESELLTAKQAAVQVQSFSELATVIELLLDNRAARVELEDNVIQTLQPFASIVNDYADVIDQTINQ